MNHRRVRLLLRAVFAAAMTTGAVTAMAVPANASNPVPSASPGSSAVAITSGRTTNGGVAEICPDVPRQYHCLGLRRLGDSRRTMSANSASTATPAVTTAPAGLGPSDLHWAYGLPAVSSIARSTTVAVIDAYHAKNIKSDLASYCAQYSLGTCANNLTVVNQDGNASPLPSEDLNDRTNYGTGWSAETTMDVELVAAICPTCKILLVEAGSPGFSDLGQAVETAVVKGSRYVSMSYGASEYYRGSYQSMTSTDSYYDSPGVSYFAAAGDGGVGEGHAVDAQYPAASANVVAVGGTSLKQDARTSRGWTETVWNSLSKQSGATGSGCSLFSPKPPWQRSAVSDTVCPKRATTDISAVADPWTGVAIYQAGSYWGSWSGGGGTSASAPIIAAIYALSGAQADNASNYANTQRFNDVTGGSNATGAACSSSTANAALCTAGAGWDGPTGVGTPRGLASVQSLISDPGPLSGTRGVAVSTSWKVAGKFSGVTYEVTGGSLPSGVALSATTGGLSGKPTAAGNGKATITATGNDSGASSSLTISWNIVAPQPVITVANRTTRVDTALSSYAFFSVKDSYSTPFTFQAKGLPTGLKLLSNGRVSGKPTAVGRFTVSVTATDSVGAKATRSFIWTVSPHKIVRTGTAKIYGSLHPRGTVRAAYGVLRIDSTTGPGIPRAAVISYRWYVNGRPIPGGVKSTFAIPASYRGKRITYKITVTAKNFTTFSFTQPWSAPLR